MKKMIVKNWKRIAAVMMAVILVVGSVNLSGISARAEDENTAPAPNVVGGKSLDEFSLYQFLTYYQYVIKENATIGNHTVGSMLIGGTGKIGAFGEGGIAPVYIHKLAESGNYAERYSVLSAYYQGKVPAYYGLESAFKAEGWNEWNSNEKFVDFETIFSNIEETSQKIASDFNVKVNYIEGTGFVINGDVNNAVTVVNNSYMHGKPGQLLTIDFSKLSGKNITITEAAYKQIAVIDIHVENIDDFNKPHNISILGDSVNVSYAYNPIVGARPSGGDSAICVTINGGTFQGGALKKMTGNKEGAQLLDAPMELLWNFPEATTATVEYLGGHVVAPKADLTIYGGNFEGGVIAKSVTNEGAEGHMYPYYGIPKTLITNAPEDPINTTKFEITVPIEIAKTFGSSNFSNMNEKVEVLNKTNFAVYNVSYGEFQEIQYTETNDANCSTLNNTAIYKVNVSFTTEKAGTYYLYLKEITTDDARYNICNSRWAIKVVVNTDGSHKETYVQYNEQEQCYDDENVTTLAALSSRYASKDAPLEFVNEKIGTTPGTEDVTIGLTKTYEGLTLTSLGNNNQIQEFLNGTAFELIEVNESGQPVGDAQAIILNPRWNGSNAVVSQKITIAKGVTKYYRISETKASDGFEISGDVYILWKVCGVDGGVSAEYKIGDGSYMSYTAGGSYPAVENARSPFSGTISLIKTYEDLKLDDMDASARTTFLNETTFALYKSAEDNAVAIGTTHPVWENGQAVVKFNLSELVGNITVDSLGKVYYIRETAASTGYVKSEVVYECKISNVNGRYEVGYRAGNSGDYEPTITCKNAKQTFEIASVTVEISKTFNNSGDLGTDLMTGLIRDTKFTFYTDAAMTKDTNDFALQPNPVNSNGTVTYTYDYKPTLKPGDNYTYYVKETATNRSIYNMDTTMVYRIDITVRQPQPGVSNDKITPSVICTKVDGDGSPTNISFTNTRIPKAQASTEITFTKVFENNFSNVDAGKIDSVISATRFTLYDNPACGQNDVVAVSSSSTKRSGESENVTYTYTLNTSSLDVDETYYYYLKETSTNRNYYQLNDTTYVVRITIDKDGTATVDYAKSGSSEFTKDLEIKNLQKETSDNSSTVLDPLVIRFNKTFDDFGTYTDGSAIIKATTFTITSVGGAPTINYTRLSPIETSSGATYCYELDLSKLSADTYKGGTYTYTIKESRTDGRYTTSNDVLTFEITVDENGEALYSFADGKDTITNQLKPDTPSNTTPNTTTPSTTTTSSTPTTPNTPTTPSAPTTPSTPTTPSVPDTPNSWITPDGKVHFEILIEYEHIDSSSTPERIEELITNTTIKIIDQNGNDVTENVTKITWDPSRNVAIVTVEVPKPSEGFDTYYVVESTDPADNDLSHSEPGKGFTVAVTSDAKVLFQEDGSATPTTELRFVNVEGATDTITNTMTSMSSPQTGERKLPWTVLGGGMSMIFIAGVVYVFRKKEKIEE